MPRAKTPDGQAALDALVAAPRRALVALDYDGTLAPIAADPQAAVPAPGAVDALVACSRVFGTVALLTGRAALGPVTLAGLDRVAGLEHLVVLGHYGHERWSPVTGLTAPPEHPGIDAVRRELPLLLAATGDGVYVEDKGLSVAVHTRRCPDPDTALERVADVVTKLAVTTGLDVQRGRLMIELRPPGAVDKGVALRTIVAERVPSAVLFAGDDVVDLPAFAALPAMRSTGIPAVGVFVANPEAPPDVAAAADLVVTDPPAMVDLLHTLARDADAARPTKSVPEDWTRG
jgi:trehalose 6-phosphate phosphatase